MSKYDRLITLKEAVMFSNHAEENIRLQIERGLLKKYDKNGRLLDDPLRVKGFFKLYEIMSVYNIKDPEVVKEKFFSRKQRQDSAKGIIPKATNAFSTSEMHKIDQIEDGSIDTWILFPRYSYNAKQMALSFVEVQESPVIKEVLEYLNHSSRILKAQGNIIIHSIPNYSPYFGVKLTELGFFFKYWIVYPSTIYSKQNLRKFIPTANSILYFVKSPKNFRINRVRIPYRFCSFCNEPLKDYGGKKHLRHVDGMVLSDVWHFEDTLLKSKTALHSTIVKRLMDLSCTSSTTLLLAPFDGEVPYELKK
ncbi:MAG: DNA methyltransferase [Candidatus Hodarchaeota archaeon]